MKNKIFFVLAALLTAVLALTACQAKPAALSDAEVVELAGRLLTGLNEGDYAAFSRDFSDEMRAALPESQFGALRDMLQETSGNYLTCGEPTLSNRSGYSIYRLICRFEKEEVVVTLTFKINGRQVEGLFFDSPNLRAFSR